MPLDGSFLFSRKRPSVEPYFHIILELSMSSVV
jgi:hypothetical protein